MDLEPIDNQRKKLIFRLSSLGDVVLATAALEVDSLRGNGLDWVVSSEYRNILEGHPRIRKLWSFDRAHGNGVVDWVRFCRELWNEGYSEVFDLHRSLRTLIARGLFSFWSFMGSKPGPRWSTIQKHRFNLWGYFVFKRWWRGQWRPKRWVETFSFVLGGTGSERPNLSHLRGAACATYPPEKWQREPYFCIMPSSKWRGKEWPVSYFLKMIHKLNEFVVVVGTASDRASVDLAKLLDKTNFKYRSLVGEVDFMRLVQVLSLSKGYIGNDTGIAHLAEALGVPSYVIFGPTAPDVGFAPWKNESRSIQKQLWCRPCGKYGRFCYRFSKKYSCMTSLSPDDVVQQIERMKGGVAH